MSIEKNKEVKTVIEKVINKVITQKDKERTENKRRKLEEQKQLLEEQKKIDSFKVSLHSILSPVNWNSLSIKEAKELVSMLEKWIKENK